MPHAHRHDAAETIEIALARFVPDVLHPTFDDHERLFVIEENSRIHELLAKSQRPRRPMGRCTVLVDDQTEEERDSCVGFIAFWSHRLTRMGHGQDLLGSVEIRVYPWLGSRCRWLFCGEGATCPLDEPSWKRTSTAADRRSEMAQSLARHREARAAERPIFDFRIFAANDPVLSVEHGDTRMMRFRFFQGQSRKAHNGKAIADGAEMGRGAIQFDLTHFGAP